VIFAAARVLDAVVSPLMGFLTDNFGSTWLGKRFGQPTKSGIEIEQPGGSQRRGACSKKIPGPVGQIMAGLTPIEATLIFAAARVLDAVVSPLMGFLTDNFGSDQKLMSLIHIRL
jgi:hypothetical protein